MRRLTKIGCEVQWGGGKEFNFKKLNYILPFSFSQFSKFM